MSGSEPTQRRAGTRRTPLLLFALALGLIAFFWWLRLYRGGPRLPGFGDVLIYYYPHYEATFGAWRAGRVPLWNPHQFCGVPWLAALQMGALYPLHAVYLVLPTHLGMAASSLLHLLIGGAGFWRLARGLGLAAPAALLGALYFATGNLSSQALAPNAMEASAWLAPGAAALLGVARRPDARSAAVLALALGMGLLAGYPQFSLYIHYLAPPLLVLFLAVERAEARRWWRAGLCLAGGIALGALLASVQLLPTAEFAAEGTRGLDGLGAAQMFPFATDTTLRGRLGEIFALRGAPVPTPLGFPLLGWLLAALALTGRSRRLALGLIALAALIVSFVLGPAWPLFELYLELPLLGAFRLPQRAAFALDLPLALMATAGLDRLGRGFARRHETATGMPSETQRVAPSRSAGFARIALAGVVLSGLLELLLGDSPRWRLPYRDEGYVKAYHTEWPGLERLRASERRVLLWNPGNLPSLPPKLGSTLGLRVLDDYEPMALRRQAEYLDYLVRGRSDGSRRRQPFYGRIALPKSEAQAQAFASRRRLLDLAAVRWVALPRSEQKSEDFAAFRAAAGLRAAPGPAAAPNAPQLFENPRALPRVFVAARLERAPADTDALLALLAAPDFDPRVLSFVELPEGAGLPPAAAPRVAAVRIVAETPTRIEIAARLDAPGLLVLSDSFFPGWRARIDGSEAPILATNHVFRGVALAAGEHRVVFDYAPASLRRGALLSAFGIALLGACFVIGARSRRSGAAHSPQPEPH